MPYPKIIVLSGLPRSGKSSVAKYLCTELGFGHVNSDSIREEFGIKFGSNDRREQAVNHVARGRALEHLLMAENVVVDTTGMFRAQRDLFMDLRIAAVNRLLRVKAQRILVSLQIEIAVWEQRQLAAGRSLAQKEFYVDRFQPVSSQEADLLDAHLVFKNNTPSDLASIKHELAAFLAIK